MVVSKDTKRKRKQSPAVPVAQPSSVVAVESSPEMPKRTKVQAQRKFAQGQSAPVSSYSSVNAASSSSNTGPSTSSESREPPTEILPNKRPKTEDFLTFLCFRGTPDLPPHLDFLNQGKTKEPSSSTAKKKPPQKVIKKGKKGRPKGTTKTAAAAAAANANVKQTSASSSSPAAAQLTNAHADDGDATSNRASSRNGTKDVSVPNENVKGKSINAETANNNNKAPSSAAAAATVSPFAVRKRAGVVNEGNRRAGRANERQLRNVAENKCNSLGSPEVKRRLCKASTAAKDGKAATAAGGEPVSDDEEEDEEYFSANDESGKNNEAHDAANEDEHTTGNKLKAASAKSPTLSERKSETPSKESSTETGKGGKRGNKTISVNKKESIAVTADVSHQKSNNPKANAAQSSATEPAAAAAVIATKEKPTAPVKRGRQKESPIFIPSPEPSGRMTRQRAFFEPVKVPHREDGGDEQQQQQQQTGSLDESNAAAQTTKKPPKDAKTNDADDDKTDNEQHEKSKQDMNVFDFSSDDEQPLAKAIRLKRGKASPKKANARKPGRKASPKKVAETAATDKKADDGISSAEVADAADKADNVNDKHIAAELSKVKEESQQQQQQQQQQNSSAKNKNKRGRALKKKAVEDEAEQHNDNADVVAPASPKKSVNLRQSRKKTKTAGDQALNGDGCTEGEAEPDGSVAAAPGRSQRPSRKTKEAATIYMGIIGHKLQLGEDEEDDISLNSFPDLPNVKEMAKMEIELKKHAGQSASSAKSTTASPTVTKSAAKQLITPPAALQAEKQTAARRGRPPKAAKLVQPPPLPPKREIEGMLVKKGALTKIHPPIDNSNVSVAAAVKEKPAATKLESDDEDFLLNEEVNETKRKLEKSFSDSDDEPLAIKVKPGEKEGEHDSRHSDFASTTLVAPPVLTMLPLTTKPVLTPPMNTNVLTTVAPIAATTMVVSTQQQQHTVITATTSTAPMQQVTTSPFKTVEKKSPVPTSKILNVPATYGTPSTPGMSVALNANFNKTPYLPPSTPQHYHTAHIRPAHQFAAASTKSPPVSVPTVASAAAAAATTATTTPHLTAPPLPPQSPLKYQTPPTTYPPPIEAYPSPKINPNFLTPKFDRTLPRSNNFPSPSPVKFDSLTPSSKAGMAGNSVGSKMTMGGSGVGVVNTSTLTLASTSTGAVAASSNDPLKDEIGSILAANLMPSKEESGKIFGIASVSLAQSSGPDNTKCTLGKCGSIHKPVLGPVVPTEGYIGDQLSSKERRKAKVNMTHEQIQKWLIECSSNPDEIQDDLDDDFDDNLRPNMSATTPPPTRDDKESTSFSSSSKATRDLGKSESAWSAKGPSLKATPVIANTNRKDDTAKLSDACNQLDLAADNDKANNQAINLSHKANTDSKQNSSGVGVNDTRPAAKEKPERKADKRFKEDKLAKDMSTKQAKLETSSGGGGGGGGNNKYTAAAGGKQAQTPIVVEQQQQQSGGAELPAAKQSRKKNTSPATNSAVALEKNTVATNATKAANAASTATGGAATIAGTAKTPKRTPVYNQKAAKQIEVKEATTTTTTTTTSHKKAAAAAAAAAAATLSYSAFSVENEKSIYSFDKDDDNTGEGNANRQAAYRRPSRQDSHTEDNAVAAPLINATTTTATRTSPQKRTAGAADRADVGGKNKDATAASQAPNNSVSLTLSPAENSKLVKVSLEAEKAVAAKTSAAAKAGKASKKSEAITTTTTTSNVANDAADSDSDGHTFYIPLQGSGTGGDADGGIQGVAVKLGREGPEGPNQKVIMHATLVTKAQMGSNSKPPPESMNVSDIVKSLTGANLSGTGLLGTDMTAVGGNKKSQAAQSNATVTASTSAAAAAAAAGPHKGPQSQSRSKAAATATTINSAEPLATPSTSNSLVANASSGSISGAAGAAGLVRVNSNSSLLSMSAKSRMAGGGGGGGVGGSGGVAATALATNSKKFKDDTPIKMANNTAFPRHDDPTQMVEAPIFRPTEKEFADPIEFIERITPIAARFGICKIIPPSTFKPECRISDEMRFTAYNQYVHKMLHRWGPSAKELSAIKKYLATQSIVMNHPPWIGGMEVDLPRLYHTVQELGGLKEVIEKKKWARVAEEMCIPKLAQDRVTKLDDIYCKYLLPYDTLSPSERQKLFDEVEADWAKREARARRNADRFVNTESVSNEEDDVSSEDDEESEEEVDGVSMECIVKGRSMPLSQFYRIARNTMALWFKNTEPTVNEVEAEFWRHVAVRDSHVCVHSGSIDSSGWGYGFPSPGPKGKGSNYARHPWNLKVLTNNPGSVLRSLGPVMGVTVPTLHVGMLFSACCWYRDPHGLSWIEYLHTGASKLWYGIPDDQSANFRAALTALIPTHCQNKTIWLPCDTVMVPPHMLTDRGVSLCRIEQKPGEFIVVFPRAYTSSLATGYVVSESVYFATSSWLDLAKDDFRDIHDSCEPAMFSLEQLLFALGYDQRVTNDTKQQMLPMLNEVFEKELAAREQLKAAGVTSAEKVHNEKGAKAKKQPQPPFKSIESECDLCRANLYISMVKTEDGNNYCLQHALKNLNRGNIQAKQCKLIYAYNVEDIENLIRNLKDKMQTQRRPAITAKKSK